MKIAVYAIAKNEGAFVERCLSSCRDADEVLVCDTGSTDNTLSAVQSLGFARGHSICVAPWRFDVARNAALALVSRDIDVCVPLDLDEILVDGWRAKLEAAWAPGTTRLRYGFVWSWNADGSPGVSFHQDKIHARTGYFWKHPVHEVVTPDGRRPECWSTTDARLLEHHPDDRKSRGQYLDLLLLGVDEAANDARMRHYLGREQMFRGHYTAALETLQHHLQMPAANWPVERAASMRFVARCYAYLGDGESALRWARRACAESPETREPWIELAQLLHDRREWAECYAATQRALEISSRPSVYINEAAAWGALPHDLAAVAAFYLGLREQALLHASAASHLAPDDERIAANAALIRVTRVTPPEPPHWQPLPR